jgi:hypothetical protein
MKRRLAPKGYISIRDAIEVMADLPEYTREDNEWRDVGDYLEDAENVAESTKELRQRLIDGELVAHYQPSAGKTATVPELIWADDSACLGGGGPDVRFQHLKLLHPSGVMVDGTRRLIFLLEEEFEALRQGDTQPNPSVAVVHGIKRRPGRPKGSSPVEDNDEEFLLMMDPTIEQGVPIMKAADAVVAENRDRVWRKNSKTTDASVSARLRRKWSKTRRPSSD